MNYYLNNKNGDWYLFTKAFLNIAELATKEISFPNGRLYYKKENKEIYNEELFIPIIYNIKHSIEIFLKTLETTLSWEKKPKFETGKDGHNLIKLFEEFEKKIIDKKINLSNVKNVINNAYDKDTSNHYLKTAKENLEKIKNEEKFLNNNFEQLKKIIHKYQKCEFLKNIIDLNNHIDDSNNTAFKYPEGINIRIDYHELVENVRRNNVGVKVTNHTNVILQDIKDLKDCFIIEFILFMYNKYKKDPK